MAVTSLQWLLSAVPKVAGMQRFDCNTLYLHVYYKLLSSGMVCLSVCLSPGDYCLLIYFFILNHQRMTEDDVQPNDRMMEVLERAYNLPCNKPVISVSSFVSLLL